MRNPGLILLGLMLAIGCRTTPPEAATPALLKGSGADSGGGPGDVVRLTSGRVFSESLHWNGMRVSFSLHHGGAGTWRVYFLDSNFTDVRNQTLREDPLLSHAFGGSERWRAGVVISLTSVSSGSDGPGPLVARSVTSLAYAAIGGETDRFVLFDTIEPDCWNEFVLDFSNGFGRVFLNGKPGRPFRYDERVDGQIGFELPAPGRELLIKNLSVTPIPHNEAP